MFQWLSRLRPRGIDRLQLWEILRRGGLWRAARSDPHALAAAAERCTKCGGSLACSKLLAAGQDEKLAEFCPNAMYVAHLRAMERHQPKQDLL